MVYKYKADVAWCLRKYDLALECYTKSIEINDQCSSAYYNKANLLSELNRHTDAIHLYDILLTLNPNNRLVISKKKEAFYSLNKTKVNTLHLLSKSDVLNSVFYYEKARSLNESTRSLELLSVALEIDPQYDDAILLIMAIYCDGKNYEKCLEYCDILFELDKYCEYMNAYEMRIISLLNVRHRLCEAKRLADKALQIDAQNEAIKETKRMILQKMERNFYGI